MFSSDKNVEAIRQLFDDARVYLELKGRDVQLSVAEKLSVAASALILGVVFVLIGGFVLLFLAATLAAFLASYVGVTLACAICAAGLIFLAALFYVKRRSWIVNPVARFVANLILDIKSDD